MLEEWVRRLCLVGMAFAVAHGLPAQIRLEVDEDDRRARIVEQRWENPTPPPVEYTSAWIDLPDLPGDIEVSTLGPSPWFEAKHWILESRAPSGSVLTFLRADREWKHYSTKDPALFVDWQVPVDRFIRDFAWDRVGRRMFLLSQYDELGVFDIPSAGESKPWPIDFHWFKATHRLGLDDAGIHCHHGVSAVQIFRSKRPGFGLDRGSWDFDAESGNWRSVPLPYWHYDDRPRPQTRIEESGRRGVAIESDTLRNPVLRIALDGFAAVQPDLTLALLVDAPKPIPGTVIRSWVTARLDPGALSVLDVLPPAFGAGPRQFESLRLIHRTAGRHDVWFGYLDRVSIPTGVALHPARIWFRAVTACEPNGSLDPMEWVATQEVATDLGPVSPTRLVSTSPELEPGMIGRLTGPWRYGPVR